MARPRREQLPGGIYHVFARGVDGRPIFGDDDDRRLYLALLGGTVRALGWRCRSYCLMTNHVHLLIELTAANLATGMQRLHSAYAHDFNERHSRRGHLFESRYGSVAVRDDVQLETVLHYIAVNPVAAGLCDEPGDWPWSSDGATARGRVPAWLATDPAPCDMPLAA